MEQAICNAVWALLGNSVTVTLQDVELLGEVDPREALDYLEELIRAGYVRFAGCKRLAAGEYETAFRQVKRTGDYAPFIDDEGKFIDPNLPQPDVGADRCVRPGQTRRSAPTKTGMPSFAARMRVAMEKFGRPMRRTELKATMKLTSDEEKRFEFVWRTFRHRRVLQPETDNRYQYVPAPWVEAVRAFVKTRPGVVLKSADIPNMGGTPRAGTIIRAALDLLAAEGFRITTTRKRHGTSCATYRVDEPEKREE